MGHTPACRFAANVFLVIILACGGRAANDGGLLIDLDQYDADNPQPGPLDPTWSPPGQDTFDSYFARYGMSDADFNEVKRLIAEWLIAEGVPSTEAYNNTGRIGDLVFMPEQLRQFLGLEEKRKRRSLILNFANYQSYKWPRTSTIKYKFSDQHSGSQKELIRQAFQFWEENTCMSYEEVTSIPAVEQYLLITAQNTGCHSKIGRTATRPQQLNLQIDGCIRGGIIMHEIGHSLGVFHEQSRWDRDNYVTIDTNNIQVDKRHNFVKLAQDTAKTYSAYDYYSVMHYNLRSFAIDDTKDTIFVKDPNQIYSAGIGQRLYPTFLDIKGINDEYCGGVCTSSLICLNGGYTDPTDCSKCRCPEGLGGSLCQTVAPGSGACFPSSHAELSVASDGTEACITSPGFNTPTRHPMGRGQLCNFLIKAPSGCTIDVKFAVAPSLLSYTNGVCIHFVELKYQGDISAIGPRFCNSKTPEGPEWLKTNDNRLLVIFNAEAPYLPAESLPVQSGFGFKLCYKLTDPQCVPTPCQPNPCGQHGTCQPAQTTYTCTCTDGYTGTKCETPPTPCQPNPCGQHGTCQPAQTTYTCTCTDGYTGSKCETPPTPCQPNPCGQHGTCQLAQTTYTCTCTDGYTGTKCETPPTPCQPNPCGQHGTCQPAQTTYTCTCTDGYTGTKCETPPTPCQPNPCGQHGTCQPAQTTYTCTCTDGYTGTKCETPPTPCQPNPCGQHGTCQPAQTTYTCTCTDGYTGTKCETPPTPCQPNPCGQHGTCQPAQTTYTCTCTDGYTGTKCETLPASCQSSPCGEHGACALEQNTYKCTCFVGYVGTNCENRDFCSPNPCFRGTCRPTPNAYTCSCNNGFVGTHCEISSADRPKYTLLCLVFVTTYVLLARDYSPL